MSLPTIHRFDRDSAAFFRFRRLGDRVLVTGIGGRWRFIDPDTFAGLVEGKLDTDSETYGALRELGLTRDGFDEAAEVALLTERKRHLAHGPSHHTVVVTHRTNAHSALWRSADAEPEADEDGELAPVDMEHATAERVVDAIMLTTSKDVVITLTGGEPLLHFPMCFHLSDYAESRNHFENKNLRFRLRTNLVAMDDESFDHVVRRKVQVVLTLDAPGGSVSDEARATALDWAAKIVKAQTEDGVDAATDGLEVEIAPTAANIGALPALVDAYLAIGVRRFHIRQLHALDIANAGGRLAAPDAATFACAWAGAVTKLAALAADGTDAREAQAALYLRRIVSGGEDPVARDRDPASPGVGELAYDLDGRVFGSYGGLVLDRAGDDAFELGSVLRSNYHDLIGHPAVRAALMATTLHGLPGWSDSAYMPFLGADPVRNYIEQGSVHGRFYDSADAQAKVGQLDGLFLALEGEHGETLRAWAG